MKELNLILDAFVNEIPNGKFSTTMVLATAPTWTSVKNPYNGRVIKVTTYKGIALGCRYERVVESHAKQCGADVTEKYVPQKPIGKHYLSLDNPKILVSDKDVEQHYLSVVFRGNETKEEIFYLDGAKVEDGEIIADIKSYIRKSYSCKKQEEYGVSAEKQVKVVIPKYESILMLKYGEMEYIAENANAYAV